MAELFWRRDESNAASRESQGRERDPQEEEEEEEAAEGET